MFTSAFCYCTTLLKYSLRNMQCNLLQVCGEVRSVERIGSYTPVAVLRIAVSNNSTPSTKGHSLVENAPSWKKVGNIDWRIKSKDHLIAFHKKGHSPSLLNCWRWNTEIYGVLRFETLLNLFSFSPLSEDSSGQFTMFPQELSRQLSLRAGKFRVSVLDCKRYWRPILFIENYF